MAEIAKMGVKRPGSHAMTGGSSPCLAYINGRKKVFASLSKQEVLDIQKLGNCGFSQREIKEMFIVARSTVGLALSALMNPSDVISESQDGKSSSGSSK